MDQPSAAVLSSIDTMARPSHRRSDHTTSDERRDYSRQDNQPGQESIPLRDNFTDGGTLDRPLDTGRRISEGEGRSDQDDRESMLEFKLELMEHGVAGELRKQVLGLWILISYGIVAILSWGLTCILWYQPIGVPTYFDQDGKHSILDKMSDRWRKAANVDNAIITAIGIPVTSAICARAAAVYCQRCSDAKVPLLTLRQMLVLADKGWNDSAVLWDVLRPNTSGKTRSPLLDLSAVLVGVGEKKADDNLFWERADG